MRRNKWKTKYEEAREQIGLHSSAVLELVRERTAFRADARQLRGNLDFIGDLMRTQAQIVGQTFPATARVLRSAADAYAPLPDQPVTKSVAQD